MKWQIDALVTIILSQPVVDIENIVIILIVIAFVMRRLTRLREDSAWVARGFITEQRIANVIRVGDVCRELSQWLDSAQKEHCIGTSVTYRKPRCAETPR